MPRANYKKFANRMLEIAWQGHSHLDGADIQDIAIECGLIEEYTATERCGENCICDEVVDFPATCFRKTYK